MTIGNRFRRFLVPNSLSFQLLSRSLLVMAILLVLIGVFQYVFMRDYIYKDKAVGIQNQILSIHPDLWQQLLSDQQAGAGPDRPPVLFLPDSTIAFIDSEGNYFDLSDERVNVGSAPVLSAQDYQAALNSKHGLNYYVVNDAAGSEQLVVLQSIESRGHLIGIIQVGVSTKPLKEVLLWQSITFWGLALLALIGGLLAFIPVLRKTLVPLSNMVDTVEQIDAGNLAQRFPVEQGQVEIDSLAESFNGMLERLEAAFKAEQDAKEQMSRFVADASHELRTPLTSIHGFLEVLLRGAMHEPDKLEKSLASMHVESDRMKRLVQDLLFLAKLDRTPAIQPIERELDHVIKEMGPQLRLLAGKRRMTLRLAPQTRCQFDEDKMKQVILNLFQNAVQHTDAETGHIQISLDSGHGGVELTVRDNGHGIPKEHLPYLFDRFYRIDSSRTRKHGGAGLGLAITKSIIEIHGGTIRAESTEGEGSVFYIWLPAH